MVDEIKDIGGIVKQFFISRGNNALCLFQKAQIQPIEYICSIVCKKKPVLDSQSGAPYVCKPVKIKGPISRELLELQPEPYIESCVDDICRIENLKNRIRITWTAITAMMFTLTASFLIFVLSGFGLMNLPVKVISCLGFSTLGTIMTAVLIVFKYQVQPQRIYSRKKS